MAIAIGHRKRYRRGLALVEMALVLPLLLMLTLGAIEYGWMMLRAQELTNIVRHAARLASLPDATNASIEAEVQSRASGTGLGTPSITISQNVASLPPGEPFTVEVRVPYTSLTQFGLLPVPERLRSEMTMAKEGA